MENLQAINKLVGNKDKILRTKEEIFKAMREEMPWKVIGEENLKPYILEAMQIYSDEQNKYLFDKFYVESTKNDLQAEKIIELQKHIVNESTNYLNLLNIASKYENTIEELQKQRDELMQFVQDVADNNCTFINYKAKEIIKKIKQ